MKDFIEAELVRLGYQDIQWRCGRKGYFILASKDNCIQCIDIEKFVQDALTADFLALKREESKEAS